MRALQAFGVMVLAVGTLLAGPRALGQTVFDIPHPAIAWWAVDPAAAGDNAPAAPERLATALARALTAEELIGDQTPGVVAQLLAASLECGVANRIVLIDIAGEPEARSETWRLSRLAILTEAPAETDLFEKAIRTAAGGEGNVIEGPLTVRDPGGAELKGRWFQINGLSEMRHVEVLVGGGWTRVALGSRLTLKEWLEPGDRPGTMAIRLRNARGQGDDRPVFEALADLDWLREAVPARFSQTGVGRELEALGLANARGFSVGFTRGETGPVVAASWAARSEPPDRAVGWAPAEGKWIAGEKGWGWGAELPASAKAVVGRCLGAARAWRSRFGVMEFDRALEKWSKSERGGRALNAIAAGQGTFRIGVGGDGRLKGRFVLPVGRLEGVNAALGSLPGARRDGGDESWDVPIGTGAGSATEGLRLRIGAKAEADTALIEARLVAP